jgi:hypothetical protein
MSKPARIIRIVDGRQLSRPRKGARAARGAEAVNSPNPFNAECKGAGTTTGTTGATA